MTRSALSASTWCITVASVGTRRLRSRSNGDLVPAHVSASQAAVEHERLPDAKTAERTRATHRGKGIARALLDAACTGLREQGMTIAEANPRPNAQTPADNHFGPLSLYLSSGFSVHREDEDGSVYVRRAL